MLQLYIPKIRIIVQFLSGNVRPPEGKLPRYGISVFLKFRSFEKGLAEGGGWRKEILPMLQIQAYLSPPMRGGHNSFLLFFGPC